MSPERQAEAATDDRIRWALYFTFVPGGAEIDIATRIEIKESTKLRVDRGVVDAVDAVIYAQYEMSLWGWWAQLT